MILVVNPSPALDRVAVVHFRRKATLRPLRLLIWPGGSGVHAGHVARMLGAEVLLHAFAAGHTGALFRAAVLGDGMAAELVEVAGETRQTFSLLDPDEGNICDVAEYGPAITPAEGLELEALSLRNIPRSEALIVSGSLPPGGDPDMPARLIAAARQADVPCVADLTGDLLLRSLSARPWLIKPSRTEVGELIGKDAPDLDDLLPVAQRFLAAGAENVCLSLDADGLLWASAAGVWHFTAPQVPAYNSIGCGDALVGAVAAFYVRHHDMRRALRAAVAASAANLQYDEPGHCTPQDVERLIGQVEMRELAAAAPWPAHPV